MISREEMITNNLALVYSRVHRVNGKFDEDLFQIGVLGLIHAVDRFDENRGFAFSTYAVRCIDGYMKASKERKRLVTPYRHNGKYMYAQVFSIDAEKSEEDDRCYGGLIPADNYTEDEIISEIDFATSVKKLLNDEERVIFELFLEERPILHIAKAMGCNRFHVEHTLKTIRKKYIIYMAQSRNIGKEKRNEK